MIERYYEPFTLSRQADGADLMSEPSYAEVGTYRGFIQPVGGNESSAFNAQAESYSHRLYTDVSTPVLYGDRITQSGLTWRAVFVSQPEGISGRVHHKEIGIEYVGV